MFRRLLSSMGVMAIVIMFIGGISTSNATLIQDFDVPDVSYEEFEHLTTYDNLYTYLSYSSYQLFRLPFEFEYDDFLYPANNYIRVFGNATIQFCEPGSTAPISGSSTYFYPYGAWLTQSYYYTQYSYWHPNNMAYVNRISAWYGMVYYYNYINGSTVYGDCRVQVQGQEPNRIFVAEWYNHALYYRNGIVTCQIKLYEGSNQIQFHYGEITVFDPPYSSSYWTSLGTGNGQSHLMYGQYAIGMVGREGMLTDKDNWIQIYSPACKDVNDWTIFKGQGDPGPFGAFGAHSGMAVCQDFQEISRNLVLTFGSNSPKLKGASPEVQAMFPKGRMYPYEDSGHELYNINDMPHAWVHREDGMPAVNLNIEIYEKADPENVIYRNNLNGIEPVSADKDHPAQVFFNTNASEIAGGTGQYAGYLDLKTNKTAITPGDYVCKVWMTIPGSDDFYEEILNNFLIPVMDDMSIFEIVDPRRKEDKIYAVDGVPVVVTVRNSGMNTRPNWRLDVLLYNEDHEVVGEFDFDYPEDDNGDGHALVANEKYTVDFGIFVPDAVGDYYAQAEVTFTGTDDEYEINNSIPTTEEDEWSYVINVAHNIDLRVVRMESPALEEEIIIQRPLKPEVVFTNMGVNDASDNLISIEITKDGEPVYNDTLLNEPIYKNAETIVKFMKDFVPQETGEYEACFKIYSTEDGSEDNKDMCEKFYVIGALEGDYTIGLAEQYNGEGDENPRNFKSIQEAVDALYLLGVTAPVTFELTDHYYEVGMFEFDQPALDLSAKITGVSEENPVRFVPSDNRAVERADGNNGVTIMFLSGNGEGIRFGQNPFPNNPMAVAFYHSDPRHRLTDELMPEYVNSEGYIEFDGGNNKSIMFRITTPIDPIEVRYYQAPIYMGSGTQNITIQNCIFENPMSETEVPHGYLPHTKRVGSTRTYEGPKAKQGTSFSAAIVMRSQVPVFEDGQNRLNFDTLACTNNVIKGNEISGFGYGVVSMGAGPLLQEYSGAYARFYNNNNVIEANKISDVSRAGIFLGYEENTVVRGNKIFNVTGNCPDADNAAGIIAGGEYRSGWQSYNNIGLLIENNEISLVNYDKNNQGSAYGIYVSQGQNQMTNPSSGFTYFPDANESFLIRNNVIWGLSVTAADQNRYGIAIETNAVSPDGYLSRNDVVVNNTVILEDDGYVSSGDLVGVGFFGSWEPKLLNNAIAITDQELFHNDNVVDGINALVYYRGVMPQTTGGLESNRNAFWTIKKTDILDRSGVAIYAYEEIDRHGELVPYHKDDYETLRQWRNWTKQDYNSVFGDFTADYEFSSDKADRDYRVAMPYPKGSILNNRGFRLTETLVKDIDGNDRGVAGNLYDIGACEFDGELYLQDMEIKTVSEPSTYMSGHGNFADAEYVMTTLPIDLKSIIRNSGSLDQSDVEVTLRIFRENASGVFEDVPLDTVVIKVDVVTSQSIEASFGLPEVEAERIENEEEKMFKTYAELEGSDPEYNVPERFRGLMTANVTPRYKFVIDIRPDEYNANNSMEIITRFYIKKAEELNTVLSVDKAWEDIYNFNTSQPLTAENLDAVAGRLNYEAMRNAMQRMNYFTEIDTDKMHDDEDIPDSIKVDVFDRDSWEPRSVDYTMYKFMIWSDANDEDHGNKPNRRYQKWNIEDYLAAGVDGNKKNLVIGSQEMVREWQGAFDNENGSAVPTNPVFMNEIVRSAYTDLGFGVMSTPWAGNTSNKQAVGVTVARDMVENIVPTTYDYNTDGAVDDMPPVCGLMDLVTNGEGRVTEAFYYKNDGNRQENDSCLGVATVTLDRNVLLLGVDWRHWGDCEEVLRATIDFYEKNNGMSVPVDLAGFNARAISNRVELSWKTYSEDGSDRFEVERAEMVNSMRTGFATIATVKAQGNSSYEYNYGITDDKVSFGATYIYRLKMVDLNGHTEYSEEQMVELGQGAWLGQPMPNPADDEAKFEFSSPAGADINVAVYDLNGNVQQAAHSLVSGQLQINTASLPAGSYMVVVDIDGVQYRRSLRVVR